MRFSTPRAAGMATAPRAIAEPIRDPMGAWDLFMIGLLTTAFSLWFARPQKPLPPDASWWSRSSRSHADRKGSWAPLMIPAGAIMAVVGLVLDVTGG